jgi:lycopene beta-cyclase
MHGEYALLLALCLAGPLLLGFSPKIRLYRSATRLLRAILPPALLFLAWDAFATWRGHWHFNPDFITGIFLGNLPLEEALFFFVIPFCALFTWETVKHYTGRRKDGRP